MNRIIQTIVVGSVLLLNLPVQGAVKAWCGNSTVKIKEDTDAKSQATNVSVSAARREAAAFQIAVRSDVAGKIVGGHVEGFGDFPVKLWREHFIDTHNGRWPDGLTPLKSVDLAANVTQP